ncbi:hypothetical protein HII12_003541 [Brettanomyces bruxellensis]|uniref:FACT complex subunit POB3 n=1 Tax=Dekkera bruxellensis TaxID=5007 RepID=A0A8H6BDU1_DEKBR|nr:hypothetical protein HII12_003541 [Brettanomyces bruxellensis]
MSTEYERIYLNQSKLPGRMRLAESGLGWKAQTLPGSTAKTSPFLLPTEEILTTSWSRGSRGYEVCIDTKNRGVVMLDGFGKEDFASLKRELEKFFDIQLEQREHSLRGWNWGKTQLARNELVFNVSNKPAFEIPYSQIANTNMTGKNEVSVEMDLVDKSEIEKAGDELVELKLFIPGNMEKDEVEEINKKEEEEQSKTDNGSNTTSDKIVPLRTKALYFYDELKEKADLGQVVGEMIVSFGEVLFLTPRGRYDIDMYDSFLRLRGKTYDYKVQYKQIQRIFSLPKFDSQEEIEVELNLDDDEYEKKWKTRLNKTYSNYTYMVLTSIFKGFTDRRVVVPGSFLTKDSDVAISCSVKANEGHLYPLDKCLIFVTKPTILLPFSDVHEVVFSRVDTAGTHKTFDMEVVLKYGGGSHTFGNIDRKEQSALETFLKTRNLRVRNDEKIAQEMMAAALADDDDDGDLDLGSADEDSPDEDFKPGDENQEDDDIAEEYQSDVSASGEDDDEDMEDEEPERKKHKK